jgi:hypothetical protein
MQVIISTSPIQILHCFFVKQIFHCSLSENMEPNHLKQSIQVTLTELPERQSINCCTCCIPNKVFYIWQSPFVPEEQQRAWWQQKYSNFDATEICLPEATLQ